MAKESKNNEKKIKTSKGKSNFAKDTKAELKKVIWPNPKQLFNNTVAVIVIVVIIGIIVFLLDLCFDKINGYGIEKLKEAVQSENAVVQEDTGMEEENEPLEIEPESIEEGELSEENPEVTVEETHETAEESGEEQADTESETQGE